MTADHTTELATIVDDSESTSLELARSTGFSKLHQHAVAKAEAFEYAEFICSTGMCPDIFRGKPKDATVAILRGAMLGFDPDASLESLFIIHGKVGMYAKAKYAVAISRGADMYEVEATDASVTWAGTKPSDDHVQSVTWTMQRAEKAKYLSNAKYETNPQQMLRAKCQSELADLLIPGALLGLVDEVDRESNPPIKATAERIQSGTAGLRDHLGVKTDDVPDVSDHATVEMITAAQLKKLHAEFNEKGLSNREEGLAYLADVVGHEVKSSKDLTKDEASHVFDELAKVNEPANGGEPA
ncbi:hypothetical protein [Rhodococcus sp. IEGM 1330]|uniref:hypothetical protein n=1 Tax=Rhodococcus sp. IEGM 1330 TaxID=3082225 RepID=UPI002953F82F|nr:hypothetical protein [Rhodococcus sp. IEGM 1330]MDV8022306.1 hypothetical protein [Rhodococcus sp. IEGM 1330]